MSIGVEPGILILSPVVTARMGLQSWGGLSISKGWGCSAEILNETPKGDRSGRGPSVFLTPKRDEKKYTMYIKYIFSCATLNETFMA